MTRNDLQKEVWLWMRRTFGQDSDNQTERALRFLEEAIELVQALGLTQEQVKAVSDHVYSKSMAGEIYTEVGQVGVTLLALCQTVQVRADNAEREEFDRVSSLPADYWLKRHAKKLGKGITNT